LTGCRGTFTTVCSGRRVSHAVPVRLRAARAMHKDANDALLLAAYAHHAFVVLSPWRFFPARPLFTSRGEGRHRVPSLMIPRAPWKPSLPGPTKRGRPRLKA